jgi:hypothetical protein
MKDNMQGMGKAVSGTVMFDITVIYDEPHSAALPEWLCNDRSA